MSARYLGVLLRLKRLPPKTILNISHGQVYDKLSLNKSFYACVWIEEYGLRKSSPTLFDPFDSNILGHHVAPKVANAPLNSLIAVGTSSKFSAEIAQRACFWAFIIASSSTTTLIGCGAGGI